MARIWHEGFEDGLPYNGYLEGNPNSSQHRDYSLVSFPNGINLSSGRNSYSNKSLTIYNLGISTYMTKVLDSSYSEVYFRVYFKHEKSNIGTVFDYKDCIILKDTSGNSLVSIYNTNVSGAEDWAVYAKTSGTYQKVSDITLGANIWYKIDIYFKTGNGTGAYEVKVNDISIISNTSDNTGTLNVKSLYFGSNSGAGANDGFLYFDDIALNDTSSSANNSWCGSGTIVSLKPKGAGTTTQWDTCEGYANAESGTGTTTLKITGHGLATNDVIFNKTRNSYSIVTVVDANTLTTSSITGQAQNDIILMYNVQATISASATTNTSQVTLTGHNLNSSDIIVNTTRSNAIRPVIYVNGNVIYNSYNVTINPPDVLGSTVTSQAAGDSIKTFKFKPYAITNHYEAVANNTDPSPKLSYIRSTTVNDVDTYDMQELTADLGIPSGASIVAVSHNIYAQEAGAGSEIKPIFRIGSTDYAGDTQTLSSGTLQYQKIYETSPATSTAWTRSEIDGLEAGVKLV